MCLHVKLTTDISIVINDYIADSECVELFAASQTCRAGANNGDLGFIHLYLAWMLFLGIWKHVSLVVDRFHFLHSINQGYADTTNLAVDKHLAGTALSDTAVQASVTSVKTMAVNRITSLMQRGSNSVALLTHHFLTVINKLY